MKLNITTTKTTRGQSEAGICCDKFGFSTQRGTATLRSPPLFSTKMSLPSVFHKLYSRRTHVKMSAPYVQLILEQTYQHNVDSWHESSIVNPRTLFSVIGSNAGVGFVCRELLATSSPSTEISCLCRAFLRGHKTQDSDPLTGLTPTKRKWQSLFLTRGQICSC